MPPSTLHETTLLQRSSLLDYLALAKPELTGLSVLTALGATVLASNNGVNISAISTTLVGTAFTGAAAGALNELIERRYDASMKRTEDRPLPAGRVEPREALLFGVLCALFGVGVLWFAGNAVAGTLALMTLGSYLFVYTPLKRRTPFATVVGGIPGALPPLIGWAVVQAGLTREAWSLFFILFFWQMPHFLALGWLYRKDYARAGYKLLTVVDQSGEATSRQALIYSVALVPASLMPTVVGLSGYLYFGGAAVTAAVFVRLTLSWYRDRSNTTARRVFFSSLIVLPVFFLFLVLDRLA